MKIAFYFLILFSALNFSACNQSVDNKTIGTENNIDVLPVEAHNVNEFNTGALNPVHGEPGHRCEIAVGAPLDSDPGQAAITTISQPDLSTTPTFSQPVEKVIAANGTNPAHGEPGHDCAIAVGAPLNK
ncbi:MAG: hypothetical protein H0V01_11120 [Bacteroidetes bacterium]|nr:hypothetical protein [Bacteroidota bacterium]HET6244501.1 hypothetical protein [Bacteroidia bacterium]